MSAAGRKRAAYINTGTYSTPVWTELSRISGVSRPRSRGSGERKYRGAQNAKTITGYKVNGFSFKYHVKAAKFTDAALAALETAYNNDTPLDVFFANQKIIQPTGSFTSGDKAVGVRGFVNVMKLDISEEDEEGVTMDVELSEAEHEEPAGTLVEIGPFEVTITAPA